MIVKWVRLGEGERDEGLRNERGIVLYALSTYSERRREILEEILIFVRDGWYYLIIVKSVGQMIMIT